MQLSLPNNAAQLLYYVLTNKAGDKLTNPTTETAYASRPPPFKANTLKVGDKIWTFFQGVYSVPTGAVGPTATAIARWNSTTLLTTPPLSVGVGTGVEYGFWGQFELTFFSVGASAQARARGRLEFQLTAGATPTSAPLIVTPGGVGGNGMVTLDTTVDAQMTLNTVTSNNAGQYFQVLEYEVRKSSAPAGAN